MQWKWNAGTACVSECVLKTQACRGLRVGPCKGDQRAVSWKGGFGKCALVPVFRSGGPCECTLIPVFRSGGTSECTLVPVFVPGKMHQNRPFGKPPFWLPHSVAVKLARFFFSRKSAVKQRGRGEKRGPQKSSRDCLRFRVQISLWLQWKGNIWRPLVLPAPCFTAEETYRKQISKQSHPKFRTEIRIEFCMERFQFWSLFQIKFSHANFPSEFHTKFCIQISQPNLHPHVVLKTIQTQPY